MRWRRCEMGDGAFKSKKKKKGRSLPFPPKKKETPSQILKKEFQKRGKKVVSPLFLFLRAVYIFSILDSSGLLEKGPLVSKNAKR
jgi:hypothetical protein